MKIDSSSWLAALTAAFCLVGCSSVENRSNERAGVSGSLPSGSQPREAREKARIGDTQEMIQSAMGNPDEKRDGTNVGGYQSIWIYKNYFQKNEHSEQTGWSRVLVPAVEDQSGTVIMQPVTQGISSTPIDADIQVTFAGGVVSSVEQVRH